MSTQTTAPRLFKDKLLAELNRQALGITDLARRFHPDSTSKEFESQRRLIHKHLSGAKPSRATRRRYERILGLELGALEPEDEESSRMRPIDRTTVADVLIEALEQFKSNATSAPLTRSADVASTNGG